jgi:hypothetical protein
MLRRSIAIVDLTSGRVTERASDTRTLDVPADFDRVACVASVDARARAHYRSTAGTTLLNSAHPRPLSWRIRGEECLVARARGNEENEVAYRLCAVDPAAG